MPESLLNSNLLVTGQTTYLIFTLDQTFYGVDSLFVEEIFFLPELTPVPESPRYIIGVLNLRGEVIPVMDVNLRLGYHTQPYSVHDRIVVLQNREHRFGILVNDVHNVRSLNTGDITAPVRYHWEQEQTPVQTGLAHSGEEIIVLLNLNILLHPPERPHHTMQDLFSLTAEGVEHLRQSLGELESQLQTQRHFCSTASPDERRIFRDRAEHLRHPPDSQDNQGMVSLAVVRLGPELFGIELSNVREFTDIGRITPIPCCPPHIVGNVNLRGEIVTLIDITSFLALPAIAPTGQRQAMIVDCDGLVVGVVVTEILDIVLLNPTKISPVPTALHGITDEYLQGEMNYQNTMMSILALPKLLHQGQLIVDDSL